MSGQAIDFSKYEQAAPAAIDFSKYVEPEKPSALSRLATNFLSGLGVTSDEGAKKFFEHPINTAMDSLNAQGELAVKAKEAYNRGDYKGAVIHGLNYLVPFIGQQTDQAGEQLSQGDYAGGVGRTLGAALPIAAGSPDVQAAAGTAARAAGDTAAGAVRAGARGVNVALAKAPGTVGAAVGGAVGAATKVPYAAEVGAGIGSLVGKEVLPQVRIPGEGFGLPNRVVGGPATVTPFEPSPPEPPEVGAPLPAKPAPELLQGNALSVGAQPVSDPSAGLGRVPVAPAAPTPVYPGAPLPEAPPAEVAQAKGLAQGGKAPTKPQAAALADLPAPVVHQAAQELGPKATVAEVTDRANEIASGGTIPRTLSGESALTQILTGQDNANLMKIAKSRGINVTKEAQLRPGVADSLLIKKIAGDMSPDELDEIGAKYLETSRYAHSFGDVGAEAWKAMNLQTYFPDVKIPAVVLKRTQTAIANAKAPPEASADLTAILQKSVEQAQKRPTQ